MEKEKYSIESVIKGYKKLNAEVEDRFTRSMLDRTHDLLKGRLTVTLKVDDEINRFNRWETRCPVKKQAAIKTFSSLSKFYKSLNYEVEFENEKLTISVPKEIVKWVEINE